MPKINNEQYNKIIGEIEEKLDIYRELLSIEINKHFKSIIEDIKPTVSEFMSQKLD